MKFCSKCNETKPKSAFGPDRGKKDGLCAQCRVCRNTYSRNYAKSNKRVFGESAVKAKRKFRENNPKKAYAHSQVAYALKVGSLVKSSCEVCGELKSFAHHDDYNFPLKVRWLCDFHHKEWHRHYNPIV